MAWFEAKVTVPQFKPIKIPVPMLKEVGKAAVGSIRLRVSQGMNAQDQPLPDYKKYGPVYIPITNKQGIPTVSVTPGQLRNLAKRGFPVLDLRRKRTQGKSLSGHMDKVVIKKKTVRFPDYATYKRAIGHSGKRDLSLSGSMIKAIGIISTGYNEVTIGFLDAKMMGRAAGTDSRGIHWWGLSPKDMDRLSFTIDRVRQMLELEILNVTYKTI